MLTLLDEILDHIIADDEEWLKSLNIDYGKKGDYWILNYGQGGPRNDHNRLTRGLVVHHPTRTIHSFPFARFFNFGEKEAEQVDFTNADVLEKMDGTMVGVFFPDRDVKNPHWQTRKMLSAHDLNFEMRSFRGENFVLLQVIGEFLNKLCFENADTDKTWVFEFIHHHTRVITKYTPIQHGLYLIGARNLNDFSELTEDQLDAEAKRIGARRPRRWDVRCKDEVIAMMSNFPKDFEGFVVRERNSNKRVKIKSEDYLKVHHLLTQINYKNLVPLWIDGEDQEVVSYFPEAQPKLTKIAETFTKMVDDMTAKVMFWKGRVQKEAWDRKALALAITGQIADPHMEQCSTTRGIVFRHFQVPDEDIRGNVNEYMRGQSVRLLLELMKLDDSQEVTVVGEM